MNLTLDLKDVFEIIAIAISPLIAVQVDKFIERTRSDKNRKVEIFKILMATRGSKLSYEHVAALNRIDLEFSGKKRYTQVINSWKEYFDQLQIQYKKPDGFEAWNTKSEELLVNLLETMGKSLGYEFDKVTIKRNIYSPIGHIEVEHEVRQIRQLLLKVLSGDQPLKMEQYLSEELLEGNNNAVDKQRQLQDLLIDNYQNPKIAKVEIVKGEL